MYFILKNKKNNSQRDTHCFFNNRDRRFDVNIALNRVIHFIDIIYRKNVLVTGASKDIGKTLALKYARLGANVMITARGK